MSKLASNFDSTLTMSVHQVLIKEKIGHLLVISKLKVFPDLPSLRLGLEWRKSTT